MHGHFLTLPSGSRNNVSHDGTFFAIRTQLVPNYVPLNREVLFAAHVYHIFLVIQK